MAHPAPLPDETWTLVFEELAADYLLKEAFGGLPFEMLPLFQISKRWRSLVEPMFWRDFRFYPDSPVMGRAARMVLRFTSLGRGAGISQWIMFLCAREPFYSAEEMDLLHGILMHASNLRVLEVQQQLPHGMLSGLCLHTPLLHSFSVQLPREDAGFCFAMLSALASLRVLRIWATFVEWQEPMPGLYLPQLRILAWSRFLHHRDSSLQTGEWQEEQAAYDAAFLAVSHFPLLEDVELSFDAIAPEGAGHLRRFFQEHPHVHRVDPCLPDGVLLELLPAIGPIRLVLTSPTNSLLADAISPTVQELVLTCGYDFNDCETFMRSLADRCFCGVHLALREVRVQLSVYVPENGFSRVGIIRFQWRHWISYHHCLGDIVQAAVDLEQFGVVLLDEDLKPLPPCVRKDWEFARRYDDVPLRPRLRPVSRSASRWYESRGVKTRLRSLLAAWQLRR